MTYSIIGQCPRTGATGVASTTASLAVGGLCPFFTLDGDIIVSQAYARPKAGVDLARLVAGGSALDDIEARLPDLVDDLTYRQIAILRRNGERMCYSGLDSRPWVGQLESTDGISFGNALAGPPTLDVMAAAFDQAAAAPLDERLMLALEAGRDAGGQAVNGVHYRERSAYLKVYDNEADPAIASIDLRVDIHAQAVDELRRQYDMFRPVAEFNALRSDKPARNAADGRVGGAPYQGPPAPDHHPRLRHGPPLGTRVSPFARSHPLDARRRRSLLGTRLQALGEGLEKRQRLEPLARRLVRHPGVVNERGAVLPLERGRAIAGIVLSLDDIDELADSLLLLRDLIGRDLVLDDVIHDFRLPLNSCRNARMVGGRARAVSMNAESF